MADSNCDDAYNIAEGDSVQVATTDGHSFDLTCTDYTSRNARHPEVVQETRMWTFEDDSGEEYILIKTEGLRRFSHQPPFPWEEPLALKPTENSPKTKSFGYIESLTIAGATV